MIRSWVSGWFTLALGIILLAHISVMWFAPSITIYENNAVVKGLETAMSAVILLFGLSEVIRVGRALRKRRDVGKH